MGVGAVSRNVSPSRGMDVWGHFAMSPFDYVGPNGYVLGGDPLTAQMFKLGLIENIPDFLGVNVARTQAVLFSFNKTTQKMQAFWAGAGAGGGAQEVAYDPADNKGATSPAGTEENADQAAGPVNAALIAPLVTFTVAAGTVPLVAIPRLDIPRNVIITIDNTTGGGLNLFLGVTTFTVTGTFKGLPQVDTITFTSTGGNQAVAAAKFRYKAGVKPFDVITSITYDNAAAGALSIEVGPGSKIGLPRVPATGTNADILSFSVSGVPVAIAGAFDFANQTANVGTTADAWDLQLLYLALGGGSTGPLIEVDAATDLSGFTGSSLALGRG